MEQPKKWRATIDPLQLPFKKFRLLEALGYPHAGSDVFYIKDVYNQKEVFVF